MELARKFVADIGNSVQLFFKGAWAVLRNFEFPLDLLDILFLAVLIFGLIRLIRETRSAQLLKGLGLLFVANVLAGSFKMQATSFIFNMVLDNLFVFLVILFQPEIRSIFDSIGRNQMPSFKRLSHNKHRLAEEELAVTAAIHATSEVCARLGRDRVGALLVFEHRTMLGEIAKNGTLIQARPSRELLGNLFFPNSPLHDGAVLLRKGRVEAAGCILPLTQNLELDSALGTRHRAALGITEQSDAFAVVVSEETGVISLAHKGVLQRNLTAKGLEDALVHGLLHHELPANPLFFWRSRRPKQK